MRVLVINGTGKVGCEVVRALAARGVDVAYTTRGGSRALADVPQAQAVVCDPLDPESMRAAFEQSSALYLLGAPSATEAFEGLAAIALAQQCGVRRIVYQSTHKADLTPTVPIGGGTKLAIERALEASGLEYTVLRPNWFMQNDLWFARPIIEEGIYPQPLGSAGISRVDVRDIAQVAVRALTEDGHHGQTYNIVGPHPETGDSCAACWSRSLGRPVRYDEPRAFAEAASNHAFTPDLNFAYGIFFRFYHAHGMRASEEDLAVTTRLLGRPPRSMQDFTDELAAVWLQQA